MALTDEQIRAAWEANKAGQGGVSDATIRAEMERHGVSPERLAVAIGASKEQVQERFEAAAPLSPGPSIPAEQPTASTPAPVVDTPSKVTQPATPQPLPSSGTNTSGSTVTPNTGSNTNSNTNTAPKVDTNQTIEVTNRQSGVNLPAGPDVATADLLNQTARGNVSVPGAELEAVKIDQTGTITTPDQVQKISGPAAVTQGPAVTAPTLTAETGGPASTAAQPGSIEATTMSAAQTEAAAPTNAAMGVLSPEAQAKVDFVPSPGTQATAATVEIPNGAIVEAAVGTMPPAAIAEAAKIAGVETARIETAKNQMRKVGFTDEQIASFGNDPTKMELELTNFTDQQRGIIAGLPTEALVSTQMEQLLKGIENGDVPPWAKPAVASVEAMLARRGMSASTVGRDNLMNAIIQASIPIATANAESIKQSVMQQREISSQASIVEAQLKTQATLQNAQNVFNLNMANLTNEQQTRMANSQFLQTVSLTEASNKQQAAIQNAINLVNLDTANLDAQTRMAVENAKSFLAMDMQNLTNEQQAVMIDAQFEQQRLFSNTAAENASRQFNATSKAQTDQFMASLKTTVDQFNAQQVNAMNQFNATEKNKMAAQEAGNQIAVQEFNANLATQIKQFNAQKEIETQQWNAANAQAIEQSNVQWRRQANTANTAAQNAINQQNVQNAFSLTAQAQAALWQELRDAATFAWQAGQNKEDREAQLYAAAIGNEAAAQNSYDHTSHLVNLAKTFFGG